MTRTRVPGVGGPISSSARTSSLQDTRDIPRPSTESSELPRVFSGTASTMSHEEFNFRTPSISLSPPPSSEPVIRQYTLSTSPHSNQLEQSTGRAATEITAGMSQLHVAEGGPLSNLNALAAAIVSDSRSRSPENSGGTLGVSSPAPGTHSRSPATSPRRRRSSSRLENPPHSVSDEPPPADAFNSTEFQKALRDTESLVKNLVTVLKSSPVHAEAGSAMAKIHDDAVNLSKFPKSANRVVGFVGDAGKGKSSVLNSLLDMDGLVRSSNSGEACTCVVTEFHYHDSDKFNIEVELLDKTELLNQLMELLQAYRCFYTQEMEPEEQAKYIEKQAKLAEDTFHSMFHRHLPNHEDLLVKPEAELRIIFKTLIEELRPSESRTNKFGLTQEACADELMQLSSSMPRSAQGAPAMVAAAWPFIKKIRVFSRAHILSKGLVLVDLPGLRDLNSARRNITERYVRRCDEIFAVSHIGRAVDDEGVQGIFQMAKNLENISIICTKSDEIDAKEAVKDWQGELSARIKGMQDTISANWREVERLEAELQDFPDLDEQTPEETSEWAQFKSQKDRAENIWKQHKSELQAFLIQTRNADITRKLEEKYTKLAAGNVLKVFCVSNTIYREKRQLGSNVSLPFLQLSGILDLRRYCISIVSANHHRVACVFMQKDVPKLLEEVELWLQSGADTLDAEQRQSVTRTLNQLRAQLRENLLDPASAPQGVSRTLQDCFYERVYDRQRVSDWSAAAREAASIWGQWHHASYSAFCRNYGKHYTATVLYHDWNGEANDQMVRDMTTPWDHLQAFFKLQQRDVKTSIKALTDSTVTYLESESRSDFSRVAPLRQCLIFQQQSLLREFEAAYDKAEKELGQLRTNILSSLRTSYIGSEMESSYRKCNLDSGTASHSRRKNVIQTSFGSVELFTTIMAKLRDDFRVVADTVGSSIATAIDLYLSQVQETLDLVLSENTAIESQRDPEFHSRVRDGLAMAKGRMQAIQDTIPI